MARRSWPRGGVVSAARLFIRTDTAVRALSGVWN
jgi:hypothetical protein